eukprot:8145984-Alexandrium_andersonii.AAC.1
MRHPTQPPRRSPARASPGSTDPRRQGPPALGHRSEWGDPTGQRLCPQAQSRSSPPAGALGPCQRTRARPRRPLTRTLGSNSPNPTT